MKRASYTRLSARAQTRGNVLAWLEALERRIAKLERSHPGQPGVNVGYVAYYNDQGVIDASNGGVRVRVATDNVSSPPTDAQLDTAFGSPATLGEGFVGLVDDNGAGTTVWAVFVVNGAWWYEGLTKAS